MQVAVNESAPSAQIIAKANAEAIVTDARGRTIKLKKPGVLAQYRLIEALGDSAKNEVYMGMVLPLIFISEIDGDVVFQPNTKREVEALIQRLDEEGIWLVHKSGSLLKFHNDGTVELHAATAINSSAPQWTHTGPMTINDGDLKVQGDITDRYATQSRTVNGMRSVYNGHTHSDPQGGSVSTPTTEM